MATTRRRSSPATSRRPTFRSVCDLSQTDLPFGKKSGLGIASRVLSGIDGIGIFEFSERDVVRHHLVRKIITAYEKYERENPPKKFAMEKRK